jgi:hypothetical protein
MSGLTNAVVKDLKQALNQLASSPTPAIVDKVKDIVAKNGGYETVADELGILDTATRDAFEAHARPLFFGTEGTTSTSRVEPTQAQRSESAQRFIDQARERAGAGQEDDGPSIQEILDADPTPDLVAQVNAAEGRVTQLRAEVETAKARVAEISGAAGTKVRGAKARDLADAKANLREVESQLRQAEREEAAAKRDLRALHPPETSANQDKEQPAAGQAAPAGNSADLESVYETAHELFARLGSTKRWEDFEKTNKEAQTFIHGIKNPEQRKQLEAHRDALFQANAKLQSELEGMLNKDVLHFFDFYALDRSDGLTPNQQAAFTALLKGKEASPHGQELLEKLPPHAQTRLKDFRAQLPELVHALPMELREPMMAALKNPNASEAERQKLASTFTDAFRKLGRSSVGSRPDLGKVLAAIDKEPPALRAGLRDVIVGQRKLDQRIDSATDTMLAMLNSSMPIEMIVVMFMALFNDVQEEKTRHKMREITFAQSYEKFREVTGARLRDLRAKDAANKSTDGEARSDGLTFKEAEELKVLSDYETFDPARYGFEVKRSDMLMQELQFLMQQMTQLTQALAAVLRMLQDMALTVIRNIR